MSAVIPANKDGYSIEWKTLCICLLSMIEIPCMVSCPHAEILNAFIIDLLLICHAVQAGLKHENGRKVARSGSLQRMASAEHPAKKGCHGRTSKPEQAFKPEEAE